MIPEWNEPLLGAVGRFGIALLTLFVLFILSAVPLQVAHLGEVRPVFMLMAVYYLAILRPSLLPPPLVFIIGLVLDLISAYPLGMNALVLVVSQWLAKSQRKFLSGQSFLVIWAGFAIVALFSGLAQWLLFSLFNLTVVPVKSTFISFVLSVFLFPVMALLLSAVHKVLADPSSSAS